MQPKEKVNLKNDVISILLGMYIYFMKITQLWHKTK